MNFQISMSRKHNPSDNSHAESFIKTLKSEEVHLGEYRTMEDVQERISSFIEDVYNQKRLTSPYAVDLLLSLKQWNTLIERNKPVDFR